ncbi:hypothetical protein SLS55_000257 [Diplodia seriata]|uniref:G-patch domain-containing protein n=1 Tax=Diplodia seriata TaxID=420778 RepID=A0ABR3CWA6_9PEZI
MDASALLAKQGWRGTGHGLGSTGHGIARPLLISNKQDALGLGKKKLQVADQWWMRAYDTGLKELGSGKQTALSSIRENGINRGGLYGFFVRGEGLAGTLSDRTEPLSSSTSSPSDGSTPATTPEAESTPEPKKSEKKRKRADGEEGKRKKTKEGSVAQSKGKDRKGRRSKQDSADGAAPDAATEDPKLLRRAAKKALRQQRALSKQASEEEGEPAEKGGADAPAGQTTKSSKGKEKRTREGKGTDSQRESGSSDAMSEKQLKKYAAKAAEKGMTVEAFLAKKERKKQKAKQ